MSAVPRNLEHASDLYMSMGDGVAQIAPPQPSSSGGRASGSGGAASGAAAAVVDLPIPPQTPALKLSCGEASVWLRTSWIAA